MTYAEVDNDNIYHTDTLSYHKDVSESALVSVVLSLWR